MSTVWWVLEQWPSAKVEIKKKWTAMLSTRKGGERVSNLSILCHPLASFRREHKFRCLPMESSSHSHNQNSGVVGVMLDRINAHSYPPVRRTSTQAQNHMTTQSHNREKTRCVLKSSPHWNAFDYDWKYDLRLEVWLHYTIFVDTHGDHCPFPDQQWNIL